MGQIIEVSRHPFSKGIHHKVHPFLHHLHLDDYVRWNSIGDGWPAYVLSVWSTWGAATLRYFLVPSFSVGVFLVFLLSVKACILLAQLFFQIMVLLGKALHGGSESLNMSLEGGYAWFVSLSIVGGRH